MLRGALYANIPPPIYNRLHSVKLNTGGNTVLTHSYVDGSIWKDDVEGVVWRQKSLIPPVQDTDIPFDISDTITRSPERKSLRTNDSMWYTTTLPQPVDTFASGYYNSYTFAAWMYTTTERAMHIISSMPITQAFDGLLIAYNQGDGYAFYRANGGSGNIRVHTETPEINKWHHFALCRDNRGYSTEGYSSLFLDGKLIGTQNTTFDIAYDKAIGTSHLNSINYLNNGFSTHFDKYYDEIFILKGRALWANDFDPESVIITKDSISWKDTTRGNNEVVTVSNTMTIY